jgi:hypothetical protein
MLRTWVENSQGDQSIKDETLKILDEAKKIQQNVTNEDTQQEYEEVRLSTVWALSNLRSETRWDLETIRTELWEWWSIDVNSYSKWDITQAELWNISKEFNDLKRVSSGEVESEVDNVDSTLLTTIKTTNSEIIAWWETRLVEELDLFKDRYWKLSMIQQISDSEYDVIVWELDAIKNLSWSIHNRLLKLSQVIYKANEKIGVIGKTMISAWYGSNFKETHDYATQDIVKRVIENSDNTFAVGYNPNESWYYVNEWKVDTTNNMEVGTFLCSLNKSKKLSKGNLLQSNWPFSSEELFKIIEEYKDWTFGWPEVQWLFTWYLDWFQENMEQVIVDLIDQARNPSDISPIVAAWVIDSPKALDSVLSHCDLCSRIDEYSYDDIKAMSEWELAAYKNNENTRPFYDGLIKKIELHEETHEAISDILTSLLEDTFQQWEIPQWLQEKIWTTTQEILIFMGEYLGQTPQSICGIDLKWLFTSDGSWNIPKSPLIDFQEYLQANYNIDVSIYGAIDTVVDTGFQTQINLVNTNISTARARISSISLIPENERSEKQIRELQRLNTDISEWEEDIDILQVKKTRAKEMSAERLAELSTQEIAELRRYMREHDINGGIAIDFLKSITYDFNNDAIVSIFSEEPHLIRNIRNIDNLVQFLEAMNNESSYNSIELSMIHPDLRSELRVLQQVKNLKISDIGVMPEDFFKVDSVHEAHRKIYTLLNKSDSGYQTILQKFAINNIVGDDLQEALYHLITDSDLDQTRMNALKSFILSSGTVIVNDQEKWNKIEWVQIIDYQKIEINAKSAREIFEARFTNMLQHGSIPQEWDLELFKSYIWTYWIDDIITQFDRLSQNPKVPFDVIKNAIPILGYRLSMKKTIVRWIWIHGIEYAELLPEKFRSDPSIIQATIESVVKPNSNIDRGLYQAARDKNLAKVANIIKVSDASSFLAIYNGLDGDINLLSNHFWYTFDTETLDAIISNAETTFNNRLSYQKIWTIREIIEAINLKKEEEEWALKGILEVKNRFKQDKKPYIDAARVYINQEITDVLLAERLQSRIDLYLWGNPTEVRNIVGILNEYYWEDAEGIEKIGVFMTELSTLKLEAAQSQSEAWSRAVVETSYEYSPEFTENILWNDEYSIKEVVMKFDISYLEYLVLEKRNPAESITAYQERFLEYFLSKYNLSEAPTKDILNIKSTFQGIFMAHEAKIELANTTELVKAALNEDPQVLNDFYDNWFIQLQQEAPDKVKEIEAQIEQNRQDSETTLSTIPLTPNPSEWWWDWPGVAQWTAETETLMLWNISVPLSEQDKGILRMNPEKAEWIASCYRHFIDIDCEAMYPYKDDIIREISNLKWVGINAHDWDYLNDREMNLVLSTLLYVTTENEEYSTIWTDVDVTKNKFNGEILGIWWEQSAGKYWNPLEERFIRNFTLLDEKWDIWRFDYLAFRNAMKWSFKSQKAVD